MRCAKKTAIGTSSEAQRAFSVSDQASGFMGERGLSSPAAIEFRANAEEAIS